MSKIARRHPAATLLPGYDRDCLVSAYLGSNSSPEPEDLPSDAEMALYLLQEDGPDQNSLRCVADVVRGGLTGTVLERCASVVGVSADALQVGLDGCPDHVRQMFGLPPGPERLAGTLDSAMQAFAGMRLRGDDDGSGGVELLCATEGCSRVGRLVSYLGYSDHLAVDTASELIAASLRHIRIWHSRLGLEPATAPVNNVRDFEDSKPSRRREPIIVESDDRLLMVLADGCDEETAFAVVSDEARVAAALHSIVDQIIIIRGARDAS